MGWIEGEQRLKNCQWQVFSKRTGAIYDCGLAPTGSEPWFKSRYNILVFIHW